jgi:primase-polymerase (primpol)-like protein
MKERFIWKFPLEQWFDTTKPISKSDVDIAEAQMMLYAFEDSADRVNRAKREYREMRKAVREHNKIVSTASIEETV